MKKKIFSAILAVMLVVLAVAGCGSSGGSSGGTTSGGGAAPAAGATKITIAVPDPEASYIYAAASEFAKRAMEYSNGTLDITVSGNGSLYGGDTAAGIKQLSAGSLQMLILATSVYASFEPGFNVISVPYMFDDQAQLLDYLNSETGDALMNRVNSMGITTVGKWTRSFREVTNSKKPINSPEDLSGIVLRVPNNSLYVEFFSACGAVTTPMNFSEVYNALQLNTLDGQENPVDVPYSNKFYEVQKYISATNHIGEAWVVGMNPDKFASLSEDMQTLVLETAQEMQQWKKDYDEATDQSDIDFMIEQGMEYNELDEEGFAAFQEVSKSLYPKFQEIVNNQDLWDATIAFAEAS